MAPTTLWLSSTSPLPPMRGEDGQRVDVFMPVDHHGGTSDRGRTLLIAVLAIVPLVLVVLYTMSGCGQPTELRRAREAQLTRLAPMSPVVASTGDGRAARFEGVAVAGVTDAP